MSDRPPNTLSARAAASATRGGATAAASTSLQGARAAAVRAWSHSGNGRSDSNAEGLHEGPPYRPLMAGELGVASIASLTEIMSGYLSPDDIRKIKEAYRYSDEAHLGQFRASGQPYISHPIAVAEICASWKLDATALMAALLHDVMEDHDVKKQDLAERFGVEIAELVDGLSKLDRIEFASKQEQQAESFRKMLLAMARDVRVILIKLADRLHNMRTLSAMAPNKRRRIARETSEIYAPIANRLGLNLIYRELQELSFSYCHPYRHAVLHRAVLAARGNRREGVSKVLEAARQALPASGIQAEVYGREKMLYGIYRKMVEQKKTFSEVLDVYGFRVVVATLPECYLALGVLHSLYRPVPGKFKDYIAIPKVNGYQSIHTTVIGPYGTPVEFQIRTHDMNYVAESGVAAHWLYKQAGASLNELQTRTHQWLQSLLDIQRQTGDSHEFLEHVKVDLFPDAVYVFTPKGKIVSLPRGATPIDFAYSIHTDIGNQAVSAKVNGEFVPLRSDLRSGDAVEIMTSPVARPSAQWLNFVRTGKARSEIRHYLRTVQYSESVQLGERMLEQALRALSQPLPPRDAAAWDKLARGTGARSREEILADIGLGKRMAAVVARRFIQEEPAAPEDLTTSNDATVTASGGIHIQGNEGMAVQLAPCCTPLPGDEIMACIRMGHGLIVHTADCPSARRARVREPDRWIEVHWDEQTARHFNVRIDVIVGNERGVLGRVAAEISDAQANISHVTMQEEEIATITMHFTIQVESRHHLARVMRNIRRIKQVTRIVRVKN